MNTLNPAKGETTEKVVDALKAMLTFASSDRTIPMLNAIKLEGDPVGRTLSLAATDRYILGEYTLHWEGDTFNALIPVESVKLLINALAVKLKPYRNRVPVAFILDDEPGKLKASVFGETVAVVSTMDPDFPKWRSLMPSPDNPALDGGTARFNPTQLAKFAKVGERNEPAVFTFHGPLKPVLVTFPDTPFRGLIMPMRETPQ